MQSKPVEYIPKIKVFASSREVDFHAAKYIAKEFEKSIVCTIATGLTTQTMMPHLIKSYLLGEVDFSKIILFGLDEYWRIPENHPFSTKSRMQDQLLSHVNFTMKNLFFPDCDAGNADLEASRIEKLLSKYGPLDLAVIGIGPGKTCHIGLNEPGSELNSGVRYMEFNKESKEAMMKKIRLSSNDIVPNGGITLGIKNIMEAKKILLIAKSENKAWGVNRSLNGPVNSNAPASFLRYHPNVVMLLDKQASQLL